MKINGLKVQSNLHILGPYLIKARPWPEPKFNSPKSTLHSSLPKLPLNTYIFSDYFSKTSAPQVSTLASLSFSLPPLSLSRWRSFRCNCLLIAETWREKNQSHNLWGRKFARASFWSVFVEQVKCKSKYWFNLDLVCCASTVRPNVPMDAHANSGLAHS